MGVDGIRPRMKLVEQEKANLNIGIKASHEACNTHKKRNQPPRTRANQHDLSSRSGIDMKRFVHSAGT